MPRKYKRTAYITHSDKLGVLTGLTLSQDDRPAIHYFGGIPYALPPLGRYRFRGPRKLPDGFRYGTPANPGIFTGNCAVCPQPPWRGHVDKALWSEDCLQLNVYVPAAKPPQNGWPVFFFIHGGFLQYGNPNMTAEALAPLLSETAFDCIVVQPGYRLNAFGFLASQELRDEAARDGQQEVGNMGFWDQRMALEWTHDNVAAFGGNPERITVGGYSAGAHSTFQQLAHELYCVPDERAIIKQAIMWSNSPGVQAKGLKEQQRQFDELLSVLEIPLSLPAEEKMTRLRDVPAEDIVDAQNKMDTTEFRATTDGEFIALDSIARVNSGDFARRMKRRGIRLMNGECRDEHNLYRSWRTPPDSYDGVFTRLCADYPEVVVEKLMRHYCGRSRTIPAGMKDWRDLFGCMYADMQVHCLERGFHDNLVRYGVEPGKGLLRYRIEWRAGCVQLPPEWGVTHATDMAIWFWDPGLTSKEKAVLKHWNECFAKFVKGEVIQWPTTDVQGAKRLRSDGGTDVCTDDRWEEGVHLWKLLNEDGSTDKAHL